LRKNSTNDSRSIDLNERASHSLHEIRIILAFSIPRYNFCDRPSITEECILNVTTRCRGGYESSSPSQSDTCASCEPERSSQAERTNNRSKPREGLSDRILAYFLLFTSRMWPRVAFVSRQSRTSMTSSASLEWGARCASCRYRGFSGSRDEMMLSASRVTRSVMYS